MVLVLYFQSCTEVGRRASADDGARRFKAHLDFSVHDFVITLSALFTTVLASFVRRNDQELAGGYMRRERRWGWPLSYSRQPYAVGDRVSAVASIVGGKRGLGTKAGIT